MTEDVLKAIDTNELTRAGEGFLDQCLRALFSERVFTLTAFQRARRKMTAHNRACKC